MDLKKFKEFLLEKQSDEKFKELMSKRYIEKSTIPDDLKKLSLELTNELSNVKIPYYSKILFGGIYIEIDISYSDNNEYYSRVSWDDFLSGKYYIPINIPKEYDVNYVVSTIIHEVRHMIDFTMVNIDKGLNSFQKELHLSKFYDGKFSKFSRLFYLSLEHELVARNNQIYPYINFKNITKEQSISILKKSFIWEALLLLNDFDIENFIKQYELNDLIDITNNFIEKVLFNQIEKVRDISDVMKFYTQCDSFFKETSKEWKKQLFSEVDKTYETHKPIFSESSFNGYKYFIVYLCGKIFT